MYRRKWEVGHWLDGPRCMWVWWCYFDERHVVCRYCHLLWGWRVLQRYYIQLVKNRRELLERLYVIYTRSALETLPRWPASRLLYGYWDYWPFWWGVCYGTESAGVYWKLYSFRYRCLRESRQFSASRLWALPVDSSNWTIDLSLF